MLAEALDRDLFVDAEGVLKLIPEADNNPPMRLTWGRNLRSFSTQASDVGQLDRVEVRSWDPDHKSSVVGSAKARSASRGNDERTLVVGNADVDGKREADRIAATLLEQRRRAGQVVHGSTVGDSSLTLGRRIQISGVGPFDGIYVLTGLSHRFGSAGFVTCRNATLRQWRSIRAIPAPAFTGSSNAWLRWLASEVP